MTLQHIKMDIARRTLPVSVGVNGVPRMLCAYKENYSLFDCKLWSRRVAEYDL